MLINFSILITSNKFDVKLNYRENIKILSIVATSQEKVSILFIRSLNQKILKSSKDDFKIALNIK